MLMLEYNNKVSAQRLTFVGISGTMTPQLHPVKGVE